MVDGSMPTRRSGRDCCARQGLHDAHRSGVHGSTGVERWPETCLHWTAYCRHMSSKRGPARETARWWAHDEVWLDHTVLSAGDAEWLAPARKLRMLAVKAPDGLLAQLPHLEWLILRGGSGADVRVADGCSGLRYLSVDQIRGCADLS